MERNSRYVLCCITLVRERMAVITPTLFTRWAEPLHLTLQKKTELPKYLHFTRRSNYFHIRLQILQIFRNQAKYL